MVFPHKGENHHSGVKNEKDIVNYQNENKNNTLNEFVKNKYEKEIKEWVHVGGTQHKEDCVINLEDDSSLKISIKNHTSGTFDWINTSKLPESFNGLKNNVKSFKEKYFHNEVTKDMRQELESILSDELDNLTSENIKTLFIDFYEKCPEWILINDKKSNKLLFFNKSELKYFNEKYTFVVKKTRAKTSRQVCIIDENGNIKNINLRIRLVLNNGINALLQNENSKNKASVPCLKIQQDKVDVMIKSCEDIISTDY